jgi:hypothetical protein
VAAFFLTNPSLSINQFWDQGIYLLKEKKSLGKYCE